MLALVSLQPTHALSLQLTWNSGEMMNTSPISSPLRTSDYSPQARMPYFTTILKRKKLFMSRSKYEYGETEIINVKINP